MDTCMEERSVWASLSRGVSYLLHPFLMPVWLLLILFGTGILPIYLPVGIKRYILMVVTVDTLVVPALGILLMRVFGLLGDFSLSRRHERTLPMLIVALCYGLCGWMLGSSPMLFLLRRMMFAAMACTLFALLVNLRWQVSLHMTAAGAATGMVALLLYAGYTNLVWVFCGAVLCSGVLGSARLCLGKHTPAQVAVGFAGGFLLAVAVLLLA